MKFRPLFTLIVFVYIQEVKSSQYSRRFYVVDRILEGLQLETWTPEETECIHHTKAILNGVKNNTLWTTWVWDSMQLPVGTYYGSVFHLGNFDQCLQMPWSSQPGLGTQYCLVDVKLSDLNDYDGEVVNPFDDAKRYIGAKFRYGKRINTIFLGMCLPNVCKAKSIVKITRAMFEQSHLPFKEVMVDPRDCQVNGASDKPLGYYIFWSFVLAMMFICISVYFLGNTQGKSKSTVSKICHCFNLSRNMDLLMDIHKDEIRTVDSIRALTCGIIVLGHYFFMLQFVAVINKTKAEKELTSNPIVSLMIHIDITVDTFLLMSGLLYMRGLVTSKSYRPFKILLKRYIRLLIPLYALSIACIIYVLPHIGSGPAWPRLVRDVYEPCAKSWWRNILMITNKVDDRTICSITSWNIHCDFQLTIWATVIFTIGRMKKNIWIILCALSYMISVFVSILWVYWRDLPGLLLYDFGPESQNMVTNKVYNTVYTTVYTKGSAYFIGMVIGYFMSVYKPQDYRNNISKPFSILGFITGLSLLFWVLNIGTKLFRNEYNTFSFAFLATFDKTIWSIGICIIIIVCEYGTLPIINDLLGWKVFVPLSKLSYSMYLFHTIFIYRHIFSLRTPATYDFDLIMTHGLGYLVITYAVSLLLWLFIEAPCTNLINLVFEFKRNSDIPETQIKMVADKKEK